MRGILVAALLAGVAFTSAAEPVRVFGLPLGGKPDAPIRACPRNFDGADLCWVGKPYRSQTGIAGSVDIPDSGLPTWAAATSQSIVLDRDGAIASISMGDITLEAEGEVRSSISRRFGRAASHFSEAGTGSRTTWRTDAIGAELTCPARSACHLQFTTAATAKDGDARAEAYRRKEAARPSTP